MEIDTVIADGKQGGAPQRGESDRVNRMRMNHAVQLGSHAQDLGMDEDLGMAWHGAGDLVALDINDDDVVRRHFLDADAGRLHQKSRRIVG